MPRADRLFAGLDSICGPMKSKRNQVRSAARRMIESLEARVLLSSTSTPFLGRPLDISTSPIEAENFDLGGEGVAYHDTTPGNHNGQYRPTEGVDINKGGSNGFSVGYTAPGEWLNYTIDVPNLGSQLNASPYTFQATVANQGRGGTFHMEIDGKDMTGEMTVPDTGPWDTWVTLSSNTEFQLEPGFHVMRIQMDQPGIWGNIGDFDQFRFGRASALHTTPYPQYPFTAGTDTIFADEYDNGPEGLAYHDTTPQNIGGQFRNDGVDINKGGTNGYSVGYTAPGEWMDYTIDVPNSSDYVLQSRVANYVQGGTFHMEINSVDLTGSMRVPDTGPWDTWTTIASAPFPLSKGEYAMRIQMDTAGYWGNIGDFDFFKLVDVGPTGIAGKPDQSFGDNGRVIVNTPGSMNAEAVQPDGKIVVVGGNGSTFLIQRHNTDGSIDTSFHAQNGAPYEGHVVLIQPDGKVLVGAGELQSGSVPTTPLVLTRFNPDGTPDIGFGSNGVVQTAATSADGVQAMALAPDGKVVAVGMETGLYSDEFRLVRYNPDGSPDPSFNGNGYVLAYGQGWNSGALLPIGLAVAVQKDGKTIVGGQSASQLALWRFNVDGSVDQTFGQNGVVTTRPPHAGTDQPYNAVITQIIVDPSGRILIAGAESMGFTGNGRLIFGRYNADGTPDTAFDDAVAGQLSAPVSGLGLWNAPAMALQPNGKLIVAWWGNNPNTVSAGPFVYHTARLLTGGALDPAYPMTTESGMAVYGVALTPVGDIMLLGAEMLERLFNDEAIWTPYQGRPFIIGNDTIPATDFINGGEGIAYHDTTPQNLGGAYRNTGVDINRGGGNGYSVGYTAPGEWMNYFIDVRTAGTYLLQSQVANEKQGGTFHMEIDGIDVAGEMTVPDSGPWDTWMQVNSKLFALSVGNHMMRIVMDQPGYWGNIGDFDSFMFTRTG